MEVTRQLRVDRPNKHGLAPIQLTLCWAGQRCLPKHWDDKRQHVKEKIDSYAGPINQALDDYTSVAHYPGPAAAYAMGMHVGRKTYATFEVHQGIPKSLMMLATGHQTEAQFYVYIGINEQGLLASQWQTA